VWAQGASFKVLDPTLLRGFCRAFCIHWILKRKEGADFWAWIETVRGRAAIINLQIAYQKRKTAIVADDIANLLEVGSTGEVTVPGPSSYRNVLRLQQLGEKGKGVARKKKLDNDLDALERAVEQSARGLMSNDMAWTAKFFESKGVKVGRPQRVNTNKELADTVLQSKGLKLISLKTGTGGHAVTAHVLEDRVVYMDPNEGEYVIRNMDMFSEFFSAMCGKGYKRFFVINIE
jgi:hypothetical protein